MSHYIVRAKNVAKAQYESLRSALSRAGDFKLKVDTLTSEVDCRESRRTTDENHDTSDGAYRGVLSSGSYYQQYTTITPR